MADALSTGQRWRSSRYLQVPLRFAPCRALKPPRPPIDGQVPRCEKKFAPGCEGTAQELGLLTPVFSFSTGHAVQMRKFTSPSRPVRRSIGNILVTGSLLGGSLLAAHAHNLSSAATPSPSSSRRPGSPEVDSRWQDSFDAFAAADKAQAPQMGGVLFVGSSSIRLWNNLEQSFETQPVIIKRGFGGSRLEDCVQHLNHLVIPYQPRLVVVYAGDNDLAEGATPEQVRDRFQAFVEGVRAKLPHTRIAYLSIKPSPLRKALIPSVQRTNALIEDYTRKVAELDYIDVYSKMIGPDGRPRPELYAADLLHLNAAGYALWKQEIAGHLAATAAARP